ncbi:TrkH family potassium uptake protein [Paralcaligenes sp. KSB-10]|uniref:TrkH family potassium uptake protein n=1 Tax=Paralcaligenes sp. KSB-10 TaxID=2901142 RepID=UPI001E2B58E9|nr:TrkH family potassium uptake protein [Paralcaligenes sp. KSB-10]UHL64674.1 TrkH family potassium uptake protein [Paralcaligenes sp. KSB-10]
MRNWQPLHGYKTYRRIRKTGLFNASPPIVLAAGFLILIVLGAFMLWLPVSTRQPISFFTALFTATSAVTVTGLNLVDPGSTFTHTGQIIIALLIQIGGLGFVTLAVVAALTLGKKISIKQQALALEAFNQTSVSKIRQTAYSVFKISAIIEIAGVIILTLRWWPESGFVSALYSALFHAVSAFNNAGFSLYSANMAGFVADPIVILTMSALIILGGIGFTVLSDINAKRSWSKLRPYTKVMILATLVLNLVGFVLIWALELNNADTLGHLSFSGQALAAWFQSVTTRTAGFNSLDIAKLTDTSTLLMILLMFIGGGSLSTASGIKVGTFVVLLAAAYSYIFRRKEIVLLKRSISPEIIQKSLALLLISTALAFAGVFLISIFDKAPFLSIVFEVVSALSTVGLTRDLTPHLSAASQAILIVLMYAGRLGPLTLVYSIATQTRSRIRYPETEMQVG